MSRCLPKDISLPLRLEARHSLDDMLTPTGYSPPHSSRYGPQHTQHTATPTQPALRPHRTTPRAEDKPPQTHRPHSNGLCSPLSEGPDPDPGSAQRHVNAGSPVQTALIKKKLKKKLKKKDPPRWATAGGQSPKKRVPKKSPASFACSKKNRQPVSPNRQA